MPKVSLDKRRRLGKYNKMLVQPCIENKQRATKSNKTCFHM